jgi:hypothetical protein
MAKMKRNAQNDLELCNKATPGPWMYEAENFEGYREPPAVIYPIRVDGSDGFNICNSDNAKFIAESREALPYWINDDLKTRELLKETLDFIGDCYVDEIEFRARIKEFLGGNTNEQKPATKR